jgi:hypothetical protein
MLNILTCSYKIPLSYFYFHLSDKKETN